MSWKSVKTPDLVGEVISSIDVMQWENEVLLTFVSGKRVKICHFQECRESVVIHGVSGNVANLKGKALIECLHEVDESNPLDVDSSTITKITLKTADDCAIIRWYGTSNGYYGEGVSFEDLS